MITIFLLVSGITIGIMFLINPHRFHHHQHNTTDTYNNITTSNQTTVTNLSSLTTHYRLFKTKDELLNAIDIFLLRLNKNNNSSNNKNYNNNNNNIIEIYGPVDDWDVSLITDFSYLFSTNRNKKCRQLNENLSKWNVSSATNM